MTKAVAYYAPSPPLLALQRERAALMAEMDELNGRLPDDATAEQRAPQLAVMHRIRVLNQRELALMARERAEFRTAWIKRMGFLVLVGALSAGGLIVGVGLLKGWL
jgi:hypothetical protein